MGGAMTRRLPSTAPRIRASLLACAFLSACGGCGGSDASAAAPGGPTGATGATGPAGTAFRVVTLNETLASPWGLAFLPDGRMLVTQKGGTMAILGADGAVQATITGLPPVVADGQGGLLDVALDPDFATDPWVYWAFSEPGTGAEAGLAG